MSVDDDYNPTRELHYQIRVRGVEPKCADREYEYVDFRKPPKPLIAEIMCDGCPLFDLCAEVADDDPPAWGVWAGRVYTPFRKVEKRT